MPSAPEIVSATAYIREEDEILLVRMVGRDATLDMESVNYALLDENGVSVGDGTLNLLDEIPNVAEAEIDGFVELIQGAVSIELTLMDEQGLESAAAQIEMMPLPVATIGEPCDEARIWDACA